MTMYSLLVAAGLALSAQAQSTSGFMQPSTHYSKAGYAICADGLLSVPASTTMNVKLNFTAPANQTELTQTYLEMFQAGSTLLTDVMGPTTKVSGTYSIRGMLCTPVNGTKPTTVHIATHGVGFDRSYWDVYEGYSYVDAAAKAGYSVFAYDRLGVGQSQRPNGISVVQAPLEVGVLHALIQMLRSGKIGGTSFDSVVGVGHSFGSILTTGIATYYPSDLDDAVLTGFSVNMTSLPTFLSANNFAIASENDPSRFSGLGNGYSVTGNTQAVQLAFFQFPGFDPTLLALAGSTKQTVTFGEFFTMSAVAAKPATKFTGGVMIVNGQNDLPFCSGDCSVPSNQAAIALKEIFPNAAKGSGTYLAPNSGHGLNFHYSAPMAYSKIMSFVASQLS